MPTTSCADHAPTPPPERPASDPGPTGPPAPPPDPGPPPIAGDPGRAGAVWVTATGVFLLVAAATVFVASRWGTLPDGVRFALLAAVTGTGLLAGRRLRPVLPATAGVVFHLGALLLPIDVAALLIDAGASRPVHLLVQGAVAMGAFTVLGRLERSVVLRVAAGAGAVVIAVGLGATTHVPPALVLVAMAAVAAVVGSERTAAAWATIAGLAPLVALGERFADQPTPLIQELAMTGRANRLAAVAVGIGAAVIIGQVAARRERVALVAVAGTVLAADVATTWIELDPSATVRAPGVAALFVLFELLALGLAADPFWARPARRLAAGAEGLVAGGLVLTLGRALMALGGSARPPIAATFDGPFVLAAALAALGWCVADVRRRPDRPPIGVALLVGGRWWPATVGLSASVAAGALLGSPSASVSGAVLLALAVGLVASRRPLGQGIAVAAATVAPALGGSELAVAGLAVAGAVTIAAAAIDRAGRLDADAVEESLALAGCSVLPIVTGAFVVAADGAVVAAVVGATAASWLTGVLVDRAAGRGADAWIGWLPRGVAVAGLAFGGFLSPVPLAGLAGGLAIAGLVDAERREQPAILAATVVALPVAVAATVSAGGGSVGAVGVAWSGLAMAAAGVDLVAGRRWRPAPAALAVISTVGALASTSDDPTALGVVLLVVGAMVAAQAVGRRQTDLAFVGAVVATAGVWVELASQPVAALDAYAAPVAAVLLAAGWRGRHPLAGRPDPVTELADRPSPVPGSWVAYAPAIAALGGAAIVERASGGGSGHTLVALAVGVAAVAIGGARRLAGPMLVGTGLVGAATLLEAVPAAGGVPTPVWLAVAGVTLLGAGIAMEHHDTGPVETGRRLVDVIHEQFS